jgi:hypothetical protein
MNKSMRKMGTKYWLRFGKHQSPSTKSQTISKFQFRMTQTGLFRNLVIWLLEIIWNLGFGYWDFRLNVGFASGDAGLGGRDG